MQRNPVTVDNLLPEPVIYSIAPDPADAEPVHDEKNRDPWLRWIEKQPPMERRNTGAIPSFDGSS